MAGFAPLRRQAERLLTARDPRIHVDFICRSKYRALEQYCRPRWSFSVVAGHHPKLEEFTNGEEEEGKEVKEDVIGVFGSVEFGQLVCRVTVMRRCQ
jgi:hypothetical protein